MNIDRKINDSGRLTKAQFAQHLEEFVQQQNKSIDAKWKLINFNKFDHQDVYAIKRMIIVDKNDKKVDFDLEPEDQSIVHDSKSTPFETMNVLTLEHHIVYSITYSVPMLFFRIYKEDGSQLNLEQIFQYLDRAQQSSSVDLKNKLSKITQFEHPVFFKPFYAIHPCHTATFMSLAIKSLDILNYILTWASSIGPIVGLRIEN